MQLKTLQIVWHGKEPVLSVDFQPNSHTLVSGGQDGEVKHWEVVHEEDGSPGVRFLSSYPVNSKSVNCVRFSPSGDMLASAGDKGEVLLWRFAAFAAGAQLQQQAHRSQLDGSDGGGLGGAASATASGVWRQVGLLRGHCDDVLDLAWAPDGSALLSGGIENNCILWDVEGRKSLKWLQDHGHYVQGVAWDPLGRYIASQSADRTARVYAVKPPPTLPEGGAKRAAAAAAAAVAAAAVVTSAVLARDGFYAAATLSKGPLPAGTLPQQQPQTAGAAGAAGAVGPQGDSVAAPHAGGAAKQPLFSDDSLPTFFRRLAWSPDGAFLAAPAGVYRSATSAPVTSTTHIFSRGDWSGPAVSLPCLSKGALAVRFCPRIFRAPPPPQQQQQPPTAAGTTTTTAAAAAAAASRLPYRLVMAVASIDSVLLYDMQALEPLAVLGGIHFAAVTDLAWSDDGRFLVVASRDGYCTVVSFEEGELGEPVPLEELPPGVAAVVSRAAARRHQERTAAAAAAAAAGKSASAAAAAAAVAGPTGNPQSDGMEEAQLSATTTRVTTSVPAATAAPPGAAPRRIQPIAIPAGSNPPAAAASIISGAKRQADGEPAAAVGGGATERPKPKRIQPIPLSATALSAAIPAASGAGRASLAGTAGAAAAPYPAAAGLSSPGRRRIVPTRVDGPVGTHSVLATVSAAAAAAAAAAAGVAPAAAGGLSPLQPAASAGISAVAAGPSHTPLAGGNAAGSGGGTGRVVPGVAGDGTAPGSAAKMPTPQVLVFGTPPGNGSNLRGYGAKDAASEPPKFSAAAGGLASSQQQQQPPQQQQQPASKLKRVTPVPVDRGNRQILGATAAAAQQQPQPACPSQQQQLSSAGPQGHEAAAAVAQPGAVVSETQQQQPASSRKGMAPAGAMGGVAAAAAPGGGGGAGGGPRLSVAQLAAMRGAAAARKAAEGGS